MVGPYRLIQKIGESSTAVVYRALDPENSQVAVKILKPVWAADFNPRQRLAREVETMRRVRNRHVAEAIDAGINGAELYVVTRYVPGRTLEAAVRQNGPLHGAALDRVASGLAEALAAIHAAGVVHRGLQPDNVILSDGHPVVIDFGLADVPGSTSLAKASTAGYMVTGTPGYVAPEVIEGKPASGASDVHSWGTTVAYAATGRQPFGTGSYQSIFFRVLEGKPDIDGVPTRLLPFVSAALSVDPGARPTARWLSAHGSALDRNAEPEKEVSIDVAAYLPPTRSTDIPAERQWSDTGSVSGGDIGGHGRFGGGWSHGDDEDQPVGRFLTGIFPERAPTAARISLLVQVTLAATAGTSAALKRFPVRPAGSNVTITVSAPGLIPLGDLEQDLTVPFSADSDPVRFGFLTGPVGLHSVRIRAFAGGTCLGDLALEISVETGTVLEEGRPRAAPLPDLAAEPGEVTLQVSRTIGGGYSFQLLSGALYPAVIIDRLARDPGEVIGQMVAELREMSKRSAVYATPQLARRRLRSLGAQLWGDVVPTSIREQFWAQRDRIKLFTIASDMDTVPWELLYPVDLDYDKGFLVEQFPVVRRVYGQDRARDLHLDRGAGFIVPPRSPADALDEVATVRDAFPASMLDRGTAIDLAAVLELLDTGAVPSVLHFAGHNTFTDETGSLISLDGGPLRPSDLAYARQRRAFESARPLVFLNGCRTAGEIAGFTQMIGWASGFMGAGAGAFIGSLWAVRSAAAREFAGEFYRALFRDGETLGVASLRARNAIAADGGDPTWLAYTIYGNPTATVTYDPLALGGSQ